MSKLRVGVIGCGGRGGAHALGYSQCDKVELVACADIHAPAAARMAEQYGIAHTYTDYREMLDQEQLDVISSCLWTGLHYEAMMACVDASPKLINAEKPMAPTFGEARRMYEACEEAGIMLTFSHQRRFGPTFRKARELLKDGAIGDLRRLEMFCPNLLDWGTHWFDMMFFYNDDQPVASVMGQIDCSQDLQVFGVPVVAAGLSVVNWHNGVVGLLMTGSSLDNCQNRLIGTGGTIEIGRGVRIRRDGEGWQDVPPEPMTVSGGDTTLYLLDSIDCLLEGRESILCGRKALSATELIFGTYESSRSRCRIELPVDIEDSPLLTMLESGDIQIPAWPAELSPAEEEEGFELLFNGTDLNGWDGVQDDSSWSVKRGFLTCDGSGSGVLLGRGIHSDFVLRLECRTGSRGASGILLRTDPNGLTPVEIPVLDDRPDPCSCYSTGSVKGLVAPMQKTATPGSRWNMAEIVCQGTTVTVSINGNEVLGCDVAEHASAKKWLGCGAVGLRNAGTPVEFRSIRIRDL